MPGADFFSRLGVFVIKDFLDAEMCLRIKSEMRSSVFTPGMIRVEGATTAVDEEIRKVKVVRVSASTASSVQRRLLAVKIRLESHFDLVLSGCEKPQFLIYQQGSFYGQHPDSSTQADAPEYMKKRRVSLVAFLNSETEKPIPETYVGGSLVLYGLVKKRGWEKYGFSLSGEEGVLVAFASSLVHEVKTVTRGRRYSIASWFF